MDISLLSPILAETNLYEGGVEVGEMEDMAYQTETDEFNEEDEELSFPTHDNISINGGVGQQGANESPGQKGLILINCFRKKIEAIIEAESFLASHDFRLTFPTKF